MRVRDSHQHVGPVVEAMAVRFERRASLLSSLIRLHNFRIDCRLGNMEYNASTQVVVRNGKHVTIRICEFSPGKFAESPVFDKHGVPVDLMSARDIAEGPVPKDSEATRDRLEQSIRDAGVARPRKTR